PGILSPRVVLVDSRDLLHRRFQLAHVERRAGAVHRRGRAGTEQVLVARILEDAWRAAVEEHRELAQLLGDRRDRQAVAAGDVAVPAVDVVELHQVAVFVDLPGRSTGLVDELHFDRRAAEADRGIRSRHLAPIERLDRDLGPVARRYAERTGRGP